MTYLDNAATTLTKPASVIRAAARAAETAGGAGRGGHTAAVRASDIMYDCREAVCRLFGGDNPERAAITHNATHALNYAIKSLHNPQKSVMISGYEHNAVTRPLRAIGADVIVDDDFNIDANVGLVVCTHVSNVFGKILPIDAIAKKCIAADVPLIVDASQSAGHISLRLRPKMVICASGHKGLFGPQGTGILLSSREKLTPLIQGGTGSNSASFDMPEYLPDALEAGTPNAWGAAGLTAGINYALEYAERIGRIEQFLLKLCVSELETIPALTLYSQPRQAGVLSFTADGRDCEEIAARLSGMGICVRAGLQCAPLAHKTAGTLSLGGTVRVSFSVFNTERDIITLKRALKRIL